MGLLGLYRHYSNKFRVEFLPAMMFLIDYLKVELSWCVNIKHKTSFHHGPVASLGDAGRRLISLIALALDLEEDFFVKDGPLDHFLRLLHYPGADNLIPMELALKIINKICEDECFSVYILVPLWPEG